MRSDWLLFAHILSAMLLFGGVLAVATVSLAAQRWAWPDQVPILRALAFRTNLFVVLPGFVAVHVFGDLLANKEFKHGNPDWLDTGFAITDADLIVGGVAAHAPPVLGRPPRPLGRAWRVAGDLGDRAARDRSRSARRRDRPDGRKARLSRDCETRNEFRRRPFSG